MFDREEFGFVICSSCGARIKANRERCLRCEAPLVAWQKPELLPSWLQRWGGGTLVFGMLAVVILLLVGVMYLESPSGTSDSARRSSASRPVQSGARAEGSAPAGSSALEPVTFLDAPGRGTVSFVTGDLAGMRTRLEDAVEKSPVDPELLNNLGLTLERLGQFDQAVARFERAAQIDPRKWSYHFNLAHAASERQDWDRAIAEYRMAAGLLPAEVTTRYNLAMALHRKADDGGAIRELQKGIELSPNVPSFHLALGVCFERAGRPGEAGREYQTYLEMAPSAPDADRVRSHLRSIPGHGRS
jgi:Flp pilus assembly protein TadD